ncbi:uncharacterized protein LOC118508865 [Anopheles stephensi]|uniref:Uncharacterized protein n=1 Tax=Anopheles stephensi TaxID=30069 RepID=A0A182XZI3_ANOST|nr:uncharacterized protein LOC118508864 [Anopheles stephensi]XP_035904518.1 uncharacterized protein LOC118508865 [Anopheles stephensi]
MRRSTTLVKVVLLVGDSFGLSITSVVCQCSFQSHFDRFAMATRIPRVDIVFLAYCKDAEKVPSVTLDSICTVSLYELQRHLQTKRIERNSMGVEAYKHYKWYNSVLVEELRTTTSRQPRPLLQAFHWYIETSRRDAFRIEDQQYDAVSLIVAAEVEHWYCARPGHRAQGSRARVSYAGQSNLTHGTTFRTPTTKFAHTRQPRYRSPALAKIAE